MLKDSLECLQPAILGIIATTTSTAVAGVGLHQSVQTEQFVQEWHKDADILCSTQQKNRWKIGFSGG